METRHCFKADFRSNNFDYGGRDFTINRKQGFNLANNDDPASKMRAKTSNLTCTINMTTNKFKSSLRSFAIAGNCSNVSPKWICNVTLVLEGRIRSHWPRPDGPLSDRRCRRALRGTDANSKIRLQANSTD